MPLHLLSPVHEGRGYSHIGFNFDYHHMFIFTTRVYFHEVALSRIEGFPHLGPFKVGALYNEY